MLIFWSVIGFVEVHPSAHSLRLKQAAHGNVREFIRNDRATLLSEDNRLRMALGVLSGMAHAYAKNVMHDDIRYRNLFLFPGWCVKVGDFGNAIVDGDPSGVNFVEEIRYKLPLRGWAFEDRHVIEMELIALGSAIYYITNRGHFRS